MNLPKALKLLQLKSFRSAEDLKKAFRAQAHQHHPDKSPSPDASARFREILEAYQWCVDHLDLLSRHFAVELSSQSPAASVFIHDVDDIFSEIFGYDKSGEILGWQPAEVLKLSLEELARGGAKEASLSGSVSCVDCGGLGASRGSHARVCRYCFGKGFVPRRLSLRRRKVLWGKNSVWSGKYRLCRRCGGRGRDIPEACRRCGGFGRIVKRHRQRLTLPLGLVPGQVCRLEALDLETGQKTQVVFEVRLIPHAIFQIEKHDLMCDKLVDKNLPAKQHRLRLQTPLGETQFNLPNPLREGEIVKVAGAGLFKDGRRQERGDLYVRLRLKPDSLWRRFRGGFSWKR